MIEAILLGLIINGLLIGYEIGLGTFLAVVGCVLYIWNENRKRKSIDGFFYGKAVFVITICLVFVVRDADYFKLLTFLLLPLILATFYAEIKDIKYLTKINELITIVFRPLANVHILWSDIGGKIGKGNSKIKYIVIGVIVTVPMLIIVIPLLMSSDKIVEEYTVAWVENIAISTESVARTIIFLCVISYAYAQSNLPKISIFKAEIPKIKMQKTEEVLKIVQGRKYSSITFLIVMNTVYMAFVFVQIKYLFFKLGSLPEGITYAQYAREGFIQLVLVVIINIVIMLTVEWLHEEKIKIVRTLEGIMLVLSFCMAVSAFYRMNLYETQYGYTVLRLLVYLFLAFLFFGMIGLGIYLITDNKNILHGISTVAVIYYVAISLWNIEGFIATKNIERYEITGKIDVYYLEDLSADANKAIQKGFEESILDNLEREEKKVLLQKIENKKEVDSFQNWNMQRKIKKR